MIKVQFLNTIHNLLTKFPMEKIGSFLLFNFPACYKVIIYTGGASCPMKLIGDVFNLTTWFYLKTVSRPYFTYKHVIKVLMSSIASFYQKLALIQVSTPFHMWKLSGNFSGVIHQGGSLIGGNFLGGSFPDTILNIRSRGFDCTQY